MHVYACFRMILWAVRAGRGVYPHQSGRCGRDGGLGFAIRGPLAATAGRDGDRGRGGGLGFAARGLPEGVGRRTCCFGLILARRVVCGGRLRGARGAIICCGVVSAQDPLPFIYEPPGAVLSRCPGMSGHRPT